MSDSSMPGPSPSDEPGDVPAADLRVSDADRHRVAEVLREAAGDGRIDLEELDERLGLTYAARTYGDLLPVTRDLGVGSLPAPAVGRQPEVTAPAPRLPPGRRAPSGTWRS